MPDDHRAAAGAAARIAVDGGAGRGRIETPGDADWFAVWLRQGQDYRLDLRGADSGRGTLTDPLIGGVFAPGGARLPGSSADDGGLGRDSRLDLTATITGWHHISAEGAGGAVGVYGLRVATRDDHPDGPAGAQRLTQAAPVSGVIDAPGDRDWFAVHLVAGRSYRFDLEGRTPSDPRIAGLRRPDGAFIPGARDDDGGRGLDSRLLFEATATGLHHLVAAGFGADVGAYRLSLSQIRRADDFAASPQTAGRVAPGAQATGVIETAGDVDWFAVTLQAGVTYRIDLQGASTGQGGLADPVITDLHRADGIRCPAGHQCRGRPAGAWRRPRHRAQPPVRGVVRRRVDDRLCRERTADAAQPPDHRGHPDRRARP